MVRVLVVDDSAFMRKALSAMLEKDPEIEVVGVARDGLEGLAKIGELKPDVVTLDIEMPKMDGLSALRRIMAESPLPVLMVSSLTTEGAEATLMALELGAVDFIPKQIEKATLDIVRIEDSLRAKVKAVAKRKPWLFKPSRLAAAAPAQPAATRTAVRETPARDSQAQPARLVGPAGRGHVTRDVVAIGVSTGGPPAVQKILSALPADFGASILIAQHMPQAFTGPFAKRLDSVCAISVKEAEDGERMKPATAYIAPGGSHLILDQRVSHIDLRVTPEPREALYKPSANVLITSVAEAVGKRGLGVILTGMGSDGLEGIRHLKHKGGLALAQSDATCVVYGMPKAVVEAGLTDEIVDLDDMARAILEHIQR